MSNIRHLATAALGAGSGILLVQLLVPTVKPPTLALRLPVATAAQAMALSRDDQLGRYFDCLEWVVEERVLQTCEKEKDDD